MKTFKESLHDTIFKPMICEAKVLYDKFNMSLDEYCSDKNNLQLNDKDVIELSIDAKHAFGNIVVVASQSFKEGYKYLKDKFAKTGKNYTYGYVVLPFENCNVVVQIIVSPDQGSYKIYRGAVYIVGPKDVNIKSVINMSRGAYEIYSELHVDRKASDEDIYENVFKAINSLKDKAISKFSAAANIELKTPSPDKSPYTLSKKKRFPNWVRHAYVKAQGKDFIYKNTWSGEAEIFVQTVVLGKKKYYKVLMGDADESLQNGSTGDSLAIYYLTTLGQLDKFLEFTLKPNRMKKHAELGEDGEIHVWHSKMSKHLPPMLKKDIINDEEIIKKCNFEEMDIFDFYK